MYLIQIATYKGRYGLFVDFDLVKDTPMFKRLDNLDKETIEAEFNRCQTESLIPDFDISRVRLSNKTFNLDEAIRFLIQPVSIILENSLNDSYFLKVLIKHFDFGRRWS